MSNNATLLQTYQNYQNLKSYTNYLQQWSNQISQLIVQLQNSENANSVLTSGQIENMSNLKTLVDNINSTISSLISGLE